MKEELKVVNRESNIKQKQVADGSQVISLLQDQVKQLKR